MDVHETLVSQYRAALEMLKRSILACPETLWHRPEDEIPFWQVAYHALFFTDMYLHASAQAFRPWSGHREEYRFEKETPTAQGEPATKATVLEYLAFCQRKVVVGVPEMALDADSGFDWLPFTKFELQLYSLRHIQQHVGELMERLGARASDIGWVGTARNLSDDQTLSA